MVRSYALALALAATLAIISTASSAAAVEGPGCEAGAPCPDADGDGFPSCACAAAGVRCDCNDQDRSIFPGAPEGCSSTADEGCDGDAGGACKTGEGCLEGLCVPECRPLDDFGCDNNSSCIRAPSDQRLCMPDDCASFGCPPGQTCDDAKRCVPNCTPEVKCPNGQVCRGFGCVDPCAGIVCASGAACVAGQCVPSCACAGAGVCPPGQGCDTTAAVPTCIEAACVGVSCPAGAHCERGACVDDCSGVVCPPERLCRIVATDGGAPHGACVDLCTPNPCRLSDTCDWRTGACLPPVYPEGGLVPIARDPESDIVLIAGAGFTCTTTHLVGASAVSVLATTGITMLFVMRRRRRR